ncbi:MAG: metallophosphoesterase [Spirochaetes bacterium]|nr:metallophosphoesterase [Spirochaetota bacterium]
MKILHIADTHFGISPERDEIAFRCFSAALVAAVINKVDWVIHAGDIFDRAILNAGDHNPIPRLINVLSNFKDPTDFRIPIVILRGTPTHDVKGSLEYLMPFAQVIQTETFIDCGGGLQFLCLPEVSKAEVGAAQNGQLEYNKLVRQKLQDLNERSDHDALRILVAHLCITDAESSTGYKPGSAIGAKELLSLSGAHAAMLGDIHKAQVFSDGRVRYAGSICHLNYGEVEAEKGCWLWEFNGKEIKSVEWIKLPSRQLLTLEAGESLLKVDAAGAEVKIRFRGKFVDDEGALEKLKKTAHSVIFERIPEPPVIRLRSEEIGKAQTISEEVIEWGIVNETEITPEILRKAGSITGEAL